MRKVTQLLCGILVIALFVPLLAGCGSKNNENALVFATLENSDPNNSYTDILPVWEELEKRTGVTVAFDVTPLNQYNEVMGTRLAAGTNLPDIVRVPSADPLMFVTNGLLIKLDDLIEEHAPNIKDLFENQRPDVKKTLTAPDGNLYVIDSIVDARSGVNQVNLGIRKDWLKNLGLEEPDSMEDWYQVLSAFKTQDPNGNGEADEIPLICTPSPNTRTGGQTYGIYKFGTAYGLHLGTSDGWYYDKDGKIIYEWTDPRLYDYLKEMNRWYSEGILDIEFTSQTGDQHTAKAIGDIAGADVSSMTMQYPQWNIRMAASGLDAHWESTLPAAAKDGTRFLERENPTEGAYYGITRDCKDLVAAIKWLDYMYASPEGQVLMCNFGIEGISYDMVNGKPMLNDFILEDERGSGLAMESIGMNGAFPRVLMAEMIEQRFMQYESEVAQARKTAEFYQPPFPVILATDEESSEYASVMADINTMRDEYVVDFITGRKSLDEFEEYANIVESMDLERAIEIKQQQFDRYNANA